VASATVSPTSSASPAAPVGSPSSTKIDTDAVQDALADYVAEQRGNVSIAVYDRKTGLSISVGGKADYQTASVVKVDIVAALMLQHQANGTSLTAQEKQWAHDALTRSDNDGATNMYAAIGGADGLTAANKKLGLVNTEPSASWGMTTTTVDDQVRLLRSVSSAAGPLSAENRQLLQGWMANVIPSQYFGVPSGETSAAKAVYVKVGWVDLDDEAGLYATHSVGRIVESDHDWLIAVLSDHNRDLAAGKAVIDGTVTEAMKLLRGALG
jgi:beta-lactamase class A